MTTTNAATPATEHTLEEKAAHKLPVHQDCWRGSYRDIQYKISLHGKGEGYTPGNEGTWCFYIYIPEDRCPNFASIWLEDKVYRYKPDAKGRITHDYSESAINEIEFHGGCTYYAKHGHTEGFRCVEAGCDYNHLRDHERGGGFTVDELTADVMRAIDSAYDQGLIARARNVNPTTP